MKWGKVEKQVDIFGRAKVTQSLTMSDVRKAEGSKLSAFGNQPQLNAPVEGIYSASRGII